eukprot:SAG31_NODE_1133_length_9745_cov_5.676343_8_plen_90_part_00
MSILAETVAFGVKSAIDAPSSLFSAVELYGSILLATIEGCDRGIALLTRPVNVRILKRQVKASALKLHRILDGQFVLCMCSLLAGAILQ